MHWVLSLAFPCCLHRQERQQRESDASVSECPSEPALSYRSSKNSSATGVRKLDPAKDEGNMCINGVASSRLKSLRLKAREGKEPPMASPDAVDSFLSTFMTSIGHSQSSSPQPPESDDPAPLGAPQSFPEFRSRRSCFRVHKADMPELNVMGIRKERQDNHQQPEPPHHHHQIQNHQAQRPGPRPSADLLGLSLDCPEGVAAAGEKGQDGASRQVKSGRRKPLSAPRSRTVEVAAEARKDIPEEQSALMGTSWRWAAQHSRGSSAVSGTEIWDFRPHLETPSTANKPYRNDDPWVSPASRRQPRV